MPAATLNYAEHQGELNSTRLQSHWLARMWVDLRWRCPYPGLTCFHVAISVTFCTAEPDQMQIIDTEYFWSSLSLKWVFECVCVCGVCEGGYGTVEACSAMWVHGWGARVALRVQCWCPVTQMGADGSKHRKVSWVAEVWRTLGGWGGGVPCFHGDDYAANPGRLYIFFYF